MKLRELTILIILFIIVFPSWFLPGVHASGDSVYVYPSVYKYMSYLPYAWEHSLNNGFGGYYVPYLGNYFSWLPGIFLAKFFNFDWEIIQRIRLFFPFLTLSLLSYYFIYKKDSIYNLHILSFLVFIFNTYFLMLIAGGQLLIVIAGIISLFILNIFIINIRTTKIKLFVSIIIGTLIALQINYDIRITYLTLVMSGLYFVLYTFYNYIHLKKIPHFSAVITLIILPAVFAVLLHSFWIVPSIFKSNKVIIDLGPQFTSTQAIDFFSFANIENTFSLLHPNWPENIFGKTYFMRFEFLIIPIIAFSALLFFENKRMDDIVNSLSFTEKLQKARNYSLYKNKFNLLYFAMLALVGVFLAKGSNPPYGELYIWLFENIPGFVMFRDPTKWYLLIIVSYAYLVPAGLTKITVIYIYFFKHRLSEVIMLRMYKKIVYILQILFVLFLLYLSYPFIYGQLYGTYKNEIVPDSYLKLEKFLAKQDNFYRVLWLPKHQRFGYYSPIHPAVSSEIYFQSSDTDRIINELNNIKIIERLRFDSVKYIIVPEDSYGEIFLTDRKYDHNKHVSLVNGLDRNRWLEKKERFGNINIYEVPNFKNRIWSPDLNLKIKQSYISPVRSLINIENAEKGDKVIFTEIFDPGWVLRDTNHGMLLHSVRYDHYNLFELNKGGNLQLELIYKPQDALNYGLIVSSVSFALIIFLVIYIIKNKFTLNK